jgi:hypothetical protein
MCRSTRSPALLDDQIRDGSLGIDGLRRSLLLLAGGCHDTLCDEPVEDALVSEWHNARDRSTSIGHDDLIAISDAVEVVAEVVLELPDSDFHETPPM